jgi:hypothetical protein
MFSYSRPDPAKPLDPPHWGSFAAGLFWLAVVMAGLFLGMHKV